MIDVMTYTAGAGAAAALLGAAPGWYLIPRLTGLLLRFFPELQRR